MRYSKQNGHKCALMCVNCWLRRRINVGEKYLYFEPFVVKFEDFPLIFDIFQSQPYVKDGVWNYMVRLRITWEKIA